MARRKIDLPVPNTSTIYNAASGETIEKTVLPIICERIRFFREKSGLEQKSFAKIIGVTANAISNWERGRSRPDVNLLPAICKALDITFYDLYGETMPVDLLSDREKMLVDGYRALNLGNQYAIDKAVETLSLVQKYGNRLEIRKLLYFERSLAAGIGDPTEFEQDAEPIYLYSSPEIDRADYVFSVNGDSMEPEFHNGDMVLVQKLSSNSYMHYGDIGAFIVGYETYIKEYQKDGLHSLNKKYSVLRFGDEESVYLIGKVLGIASPEDIANKEDISAYLTIHGVIK